MFKNKANLDKILKISIIIGISLISFSIFYHFVISPIYEDINKPKPATAVF